MVGDQLVVRRRPSSDADSAAEPEERWTISGLVFDPSFRNQFGRNDPEGVLITTYTDAQAMTGDVGLTEISARFVDHATAKERLNVLADLIANETLYNPAFTQNEDPAENYQIAVLETTRTSTQWLAVIVLIVAVAVVLNMSVALGTTRNLPTDTTPMVVESRRIVGYAVLALILGISGGLLVGDLVARRLIELFNLVLDDVAISDSSILPGVLAGLAVAVVAVLGWGLGAIGGRVFAKPLPDSSAAEPDQSPITTRQRISRGMRRRWHLTLTILTLTVAAGALMGVGAVPASIDQFLTDFGAVFGYHFSVTSLDSEELPAAEAIIRENYTDLSHEGVGMISSITLSKGLGNQREEILAVIHGIDWPSTAFNLTYTEGSGLDQNPAGVVIARPVADFSGKGVGDTFTFSTYGDILEGTDFVVVGIADFPGPYMWFDWREYARFVGNSDADGNPLPNTLLLTLPIEDPNADEVDDVIGAITDAFHAQDISEQTQNIIGIQDGIADTVAANRTLFMFAALLISLVAGMGLVVALLMEGDHSAVHAEGLTRQFRLLVRGLAVGVIPWLLGLPISYVLGEELIAMVDLGDEFALDYPPLIAAVVLVGILAIALIMRFSLSLGGAQRTLSDDLPK